MKVYTDKKSASNFECEGGCNNSTFTVRAYLSSKLRTCATVMHSS